MAKKTRWKSKHTRYIIEAYVDNQGNPVYYTDMSFDDGYYSPDPLEAERYTTRKAVDAQVAYLKETLEELNEDEAAAFKYRARTLLTTVEVK